MNDEEFKIPAPEGGWWQRFVEGFFWGLILGVFVSWSVWGDWVNTAGVIIFTALLFGFFGCFLSKSWFRTMVELWSRL